MNNVIVDFVDMEIDNNVLVNWVDHRNALLREFGRIIELMKKAVEEGKLDVQGVEVLDPEKSELAKEMGIRTPGRYALRVR